MPDILDRLYNAETVALQRAQVDPSHCDALEAIGDAIDALEDYDDQQKMITLKDMLLSMAYWASSIAKVKPA